MEEKTNSVSNSTIIPKKRGRKPKGGKIVKNEKNSINVNIEKKNIILHLKCKLSDIKVEDITNYNPEICNVEPYTEDNSYEVVKEELLDDKIETNFTFFIHGRNGNDYKVEGDVVSIKLEILEEVVNT
jgi:hypothetical protein